MENMIGCMKGGWREGNVEKERDRGEEGMGLGRGRRRGGRENQDKNDVMKKKRNNISDGKEEVE